jgi:hypothetical protein
MSSVSALKVYSLFGKKLLSEDALQSWSNATMTPPPTTTNSTPVTAQDMSYAAAVQSAPVAQNPVPATSADPPGGWAGLMSLLTEMNSGIKTLQTNMGTVNAGLEKVTNKLSSFQSKIREKVTNVEQRFDDLKNDVEERFDGLQSEVRDAIMSEVELKWNEWKAMMKDEIVSELKADLGTEGLSVVPPDLPHSAVGAKFQHLLRLSRSLQNNFCMGHSKMKKPVVRAHVVLKQFFPEFDISVAGKRDNVLVRFSVVPKSSASFRAKLQEVRGAILTYGWWVAQENPADLRAMYTLTNDFLKFAKGNKPELKSFFLTIESGWVFFRDQPLLPVFLIPADSNEWDVLSGLLLAKLKCAKGTDWLSRVAENPKPDVTFLGKWITAMKLKQELADALVPLFSQQDGVDAVMGEAESLSG